MASPLRTTSRWTYQRVLLCLAILVINGMEIRHLSYFPDIFFAALLVTAIFARLDQLFHFLLLFVCLLGFWRVAPLVSPSVQLLPVLGMFLPLLISTAIVYPLKRQRFLLSWWRLGHVDKKTWTWMALTVLVSSLALYAWAVWTDNLGIGAKMARNWNALPKATLYFVLVPGFALFNALAEEGFYRGVVQTAAEALFSPTAAILLQASVFAAAHFAQGFPNGPLGYAMTFIYAVMLGALRVRSRGLLAPYLAHVGADLTIGYFLFSQ